MASTMELEIFPGEGIGPFKLGMSISQVISNIKMMSTKILKRVDIKFSESELLEKDILIDLTRIGLLLRFDPIVQRLYVIEIYNLRLINLRKGGTLFNSINSVATIYGIYSLFEYSLLGKYDATNRLYHLNYNGLSVSFLMPEGFVFNQDSSKKGKLPFDLEGNQPEAKRILIFQGTFPPNSYSTKIPLHLRSSQDTDDILLPYHSILAEVGKGIEIAGTKINFGSDSQSILYILGSPSKIYYKQLQNAIFSPSSDANFETLDFFFNYFDLGLDVMIDGETKTCKKFIFHTNLPNHYHFNRYAKCNFSISFPVDYIEKDKNNDNNNNNNEIKKEKQILIEEFKMDSIEETVDERGNRVFKVKPDTKWSDIRNRFGECGDPVVVSKAHKQFTTNFFTYKGAVFEVLENDCLASVCLFKCD